MPIYAYRCAACGHSRDVLQKLSDPVLSTCPACGADQFEKQLTAAGFQLKGSGWYVTDFRNNSGGGAKSSAPASGSASSGAADSGSKSDSSGASSSEGKPSASAGGCGTSCACH